MRRGRELTLTTGNQPRRGKAPNEKPFMRHRANHRDHAVRIRATIFTSLMVMFLGGAGARAATPPSFRPPAVPLVAHDPYFSLWSPADKLTDADTVHWTGKPHRLTGLARIDGQTFRILGKAPAAVPALPQTRVEVLPTRTLCAFEGEGLALTLTFMTPALPDDLDALARPVTYLACEVRATDGRSHQVACYFDAAAELAVNEPRQMVVWAKDGTDALTVVKVGARDQAVLAKKGDDLRIDWGYFYLAVPNGPGNTALILPPTAARGAFAEGGEFPMMKMRTPLSAEAAPVAAAVFEMGPVGAEPVSRWLMLAYDDEFSVNYFGKNLRPYWRRGGDDAAALLGKAAADYERLKSRCLQFDRELTEALRKAGGEKYAQMCALAYRQTLAGNKVVADANGRPLMFPKENFSNGCIGTVDVLFPQAPFFLVLSPALTKAMLVPILDYAASPRWPYGYAPHDLGTYPHATGQVYGMEGADGDRMPVEESGNMLIMLAALAKHEGNAELATNYWPMLTRWADYLVKEGLEPRNQLCSADMFGHLPRAANLALKAIIGIGGFGQLCERSGKPEEARKYLELARDYAAKWQDLARDEGRTRLAYDLPGTWGMKHNLIWDRVLGLGLFPDSLGEREIAWYRQVQGPFGLPVDNRTDTCLIDWALWSMAPARRPEDFQALFDPIWRYAHETPSRVPLSDWFTTTDAKQKGFQARPVVGGLFIKLLADPSSWNLWAGRGENARGSWAPLPAPAPPNALEPDRPRAAVSGPVSHFQSLAGPWRFQLDPSGEGEARGWFRMTFDDTIRLPGTTDENQKSRRNDHTNFTSHLSRLYPYSGPAWYQRDVEIPAAWGNKRITLLLERTKMTTVWVDDRAMGHADSLAAMQVFDLTAALAPGPHRLTLRVDNQKHPPVSGGHQLSEDTQTDWNGVIGRLELRATDKAWLDDVQVYPERAARRLTVRITLGNVSGKDASGVVELSARSWNAGEARSVAPVTLAFEHAAAIIEAKYELGPDALLWDEFSPALYQLSVRLRASGGGERFNDERQVDFGLREFSAQGTQFAINGKNIFLRGKHDACVFPLSGYPPMDVAGWVRVFQIAKDYGLNHYRFHSWCPPEAAFAAADQLGFYLQPELPCVGDDAASVASVEYLRAEGQRILRDFGNHPSFAMFALGNEMQRGREARAALVGAFRQSDRRHLYAQSSNYEFGDPKRAETDEYWTTFRTQSGAEGNVRGSYSHADKPLGHVQSAPPSTTNDYAQAIRAIPVPVIGHEVGQYQVSPNFQEIAKYAGVLKPWNLEVFRRRLEAKGMLDEDEAFVKASGALAVINYREEVEAALRTPGFGGFQLLDLQDFPGQGTALVGILDAFMDSKGLIMPEKWREFCSPTVVLARFPKYAWTTAETFACQIQVANYGASAIPHAVIAWSLRQTDGRELAAGRFEARDIPQGTLADLGVFRTPFAEANAPKKLQLTIGIDGTDRLNHYDLWVYPAPVNPAAPAGVTISRAFDEATQRVLADGGRVLLLPEPARLTNSVEGFFASDFWCCPMFRAICEGAKVPLAPGTLGILCDPAHPAFAQFPTEFHSNYQWWPILMNSRAVILDETPASYRAIVQVIDNFERNHKLGLLFETKVGPGRLLVCTADLEGHKDEPEPRQLLASLLAYAGSAQFNPTGEIPPEQFKELVPP